MNWAHLTDSNLSCPLCILVIVHDLVTIDLFIDFIFISLLGPVFFVNSGIFLMFNAASPITGLCQTCGRYHYFFRFLLFFATIKSDFSLNTCGQTFASPVPVVLVLTTTRLA